MWRRLFNLFTLASLLFCLASLGLWGRSLGHFELFQAQYTRWPQADEVRTWHGSFCWYSNTLRLEVIRMPFAPSKLPGASPSTEERIRALYPPGMRWNFFGDDITGAMNGFGPGFAARHFPYGTTGVSGDRWLLAVRPWLPTLLFAVLPAIWLYRYRRATRTTPVWQFGLRELFVVTSLVAVLLFVFVWLKH